jgi:plastocyanin
MQLACRESTSEQFSFNNQGYTAMKKSQVAAASVIMVMSVVLLTGCTKAGTSPYGATSAPPAASQPNTVVMSNIAFGPDSIIVSVGTSVVWQNNDGVNHTATSDTGLFDTGIISPGTSKSLTFNAAGRFPYHCTVHPMMTATVIVK